MPVPKLGSSRRVHHAILVAALYQRAVFFVEPVKVPGTINFHPAPHRRRIPQPRDLLTSNGQARVSRLQYEHVRPPGGAPSVPCSIANAPLILDSRTPAIFETEELSVNQRFG